MELPKTPSFRLDGKRALVTGAGRGIGPAAPAALAATQRGRQHRSRQRVTRSENGTAPQQGRLAGRATSGRAHY